MPRVSFNMKSSPINNNKTTTSTSKIKRRQLTSSPRRKVSSIIPLPSSHVRRTPSECDLAEDQKRAEYTDTRMYAVS